MHVFQRYELYLIAYTPTDDVNITSCHVLYGLGLNFVCFSEPNIISYLNILFHLKMSASTWVMIYLHMDLMGKPSMSP